MSGRPPIHWERVRTIAVREFLSTVRRKGFLFTLIAMPLYAVFAGTMGALPTMLARKSTEARLVAVVDPAGALGTPAGATVPMSPDPAGQADYQARFYASFEDARKAFDAGEVRAILRLDPDFMATGGMSQYRHPGGLFTGRRIGPPFGDFVRERLLQGRTDAAITARVLDPVADSIYVSTPEGVFEPEDMKRRLLGFLLPVAFAFVLGIGIFSAGSYLLQGLGEEKESRILESILALVTPDELLAGKLFGLGSAALVLVLVWSALGAAGMVSQASGVQVPAMALVAAPLYFLVGYFFFGSFMLGIGSLVSSFQEANQFAAMISFTAMLPFFVVGAIVDQPNGPLAIALSLFPWTAPTAMMMRLPSGVVPAWQVALSLVLLVVSTLFMLRFAARIFRIGLLMYGKTPSLPEILRWARSA